MQLLVKTLANELPEMLFGIVSQVEDKLRVIGTYRLISFFGDACNSDIGNFLFLMYIN